MGSSESMLGILFTLWGVGFDVFTSDRTFCLSRVMWAKSLCLKPLAVLSKMVLYSARAGALHFEFRKGRCFSLLWPWAEHDGVGGLGFSLIFVLTLSGAMEQSNIKWLGEVLV